MTSTGLGDIHNINIATPTAMEETAAPIRIVRLFIQAAAAEANSKSSFATTRQDVLISINAQGTTMTGTTERLTSF
jgi:hypothetical protein